MADAPRPRDTGNVSLAELDRLVEGMVDRMAERVALPVEPRSPRTWGRRLKLGAGAAALAAAVLVLSCPTRPTASLRTAFDDEVAPRVDGDRILRRTYVMEETGEEIPYAVYLPAGYDESRAWPLAVGLMGAGLQYDFLMGFRGILDAADRHGYVLATPLGYVRGSLFGGTGIPELDRRARQDVFNVVDEVRAAYRIDPERVYLWGHSAGAEAAFDLATREPERWSGRVALLAAGDSFSGRIPAGRDAAGLHLLMFIGADDTDGQAREASVRMRRAGMDVEYLELPQGDHFLWMDYDRIDPLFRFFDGERVGETEP